MIQVPAFSTRRNTVTPQVNRDWYLRKMRVVGEWSWQGVEAETWRLAVDKGGHGLEITRRELPGALVDLHE